MNLNLKWSRTLAPNPLCIPPETCHDQYMVNAVAISDDGTRIVGGTYYQHYQGTTRRNHDGTFGTYCYDTAGTGTLLFKDEFFGDKGVYAVAISGDGTVAAAGGLLADGEPNPPKKGLLRAYDVPSGASLLDSADFADRVTSIGLSRDGNILAAVSVRVLRVFIRSASGAFSSPPATFVLEEYCETLAVHPSGQWVVAADKQGWVYVFTIAGGTVQPPVKWKAEEPESSLPNAPMQPVKFHSVSVARVSDRFAAGGRDFVYLLSPASVAASVPGPLARFTTFDGAHHDVRWVAVADDGSFVTLVMNDRAADGTGTGQLVKLSFDGSSTLQKDWAQPLVHLPNSTSVNGAGTLITAADGYPDNVPGIFYLFDANGTEIGRHNTVKMCWPMSISTNGAGIVGGDDNNTLFFFQP